MRVTGGDFPSRTSLKSLEATEANVALPDCQNSSSDKATPVSKRTMSKLKKAPDAPKRFKSAFIFFSTEKHKEIRLQMGNKGVAEKTTNVAKLVSEAWRDLSPEEREKWETLARRDKARYDAERAMYKGPWKVPANKRTPKDPTAPKRPMSAFLAFSNSRRAMVKRQIPDASNAEISKTLSNMWKEAPDDLRQQYIDEEFEKRQAYKTAMSVWRKNFDEEKRVERQIREESALRAAEESEQSVYSRTVDDNDSAEVPPSASYPATDPDNYLVASSQQPLVTSSAMGASLYGTAGMGAANPYFSTFRGFGSAFGSNAMASLGGGCLNMSDVEQQIAAYNQLGHLNSLFRANFGPNAAAGGSLNQLGHGLSAYSQLDAANDALAYEFGMGQLPGGANAVAAAQFRNQGQYPFSGQGAFPPGWN